MVHTHCPTPRPIQTPIKCVQNPMEICIVLSLSSITSPDNSMQSIFIVLGVGQCEHTIRRCIFWIFVSFLFIIDLSMGVFFVPALRIATDWYIPSSRTYDFHSLFHSFKSVFWMLSKGKRCNTNAVNDETLV